MKIAYSTKTHLKYIKYYRRKYQSVKYKNMSMRQNF